MVARGRAVVSTLTMRSLLFVALALAPLLARAQDAPPPPRGRGDPGLVARLDPLLADKALGRAQMSVLVERLDGGPPLYAHDAELRLHPASNTKVVTTAAALALLGPAYQWHTELAATGYEGGVADTLHLIGHGDPRFVSESLWKLVDDAEDAGLRRVKGDLIVDDTWFTDRRLAPGFEEKDQDSAYRAASGAMSLNFNSVAITIAPGAEAGKPPVVRVRPDSGYLEVVNDATTVERGRERLTVAAKAHGDRTRVVVGGSIPRTHRGLSVRRRIDNPPLYAGLAAKHMLARAGIEVGGEVRVGPAPGKRRRLARQESPPLWQVLGDVNKLSNNFMAEALVLTLGREKGGKGDWETGTRVVRGWLDEVVGLDAGYRYVNGSGLFGQTAFSARDMVMVLRHMDGLRPPMPEYAASMAVGGVDGTLQRRTRALGRGVVRGKTGTLDGVVCLSGYVTFADGSRGLFSFLMNDLEGSAWAAWKAQDAMLEAIAGYTPPARAQKNR